MPRYFTHYWTNETFRYEQAVTDGDSGLLDHTASNLFRKRGIQSGDILYVCTVVGGNLFLIGRMQVEAILSHSDAEKRLGTANLWEAQDHAIAQEGTASRRYFELAVDEEIVTQLRFKSGQAENPLRFVRQGQLDQQTLRGVRELTAASGGLLNQLLDKTQTTTNQMEDVISQAFDPANVTDARIWTQLSLSLRKGQPKFRNDLLKAYQRRCAITGCDAVQALEAAHIYPYRGPSTNHPSNGLLLRSDIHTLFDLGLIAIDTDTMTVLVASELNSTVYVALAGYRLQSPVNTSYEPSKEALDLQRSKAGL